MERERLSVLLVDDEKEILSTFGEYLTGKGFATILCEDPFEAVEAARSSRIDVAVVDFLMPGMDGITLVKRLKGIDEDIVCIMLTAHGTVPVCDEAYQAGICRFLQKPITLQELHKAIEDILVRRAGRLLLSRAENRESGAGCDESQDPASLFIEAARRMLSEGGEETNAADLKRFKDTAMAAFLEEAYHKCRGDIDKMQELCGMSRASIYRLLKKYGIGRNKAGDYDGEEP